ncbi:ATPase, V0 complex, subunit E1/e2, partial [Globomyces pollinis-pini]
MPASTIVASFFFFLISTGVGFKFVPNGEEQVVHRTCLVMTVTCCWLMWAVTYMAQLNPLIQP